VKPPSPAYGDTIPFDGDHGPLTSNRFIFKFCNDSPPTERGSLSSIGFFAEDVSDGKNSNGNASKRRSAPRSELTPPTTCKLALGCCYVREKNPSCFGSSSLSPFILDNVEKEGLTEVEKKSKSADGASRRSAEVGKKARHNAQFSLAL
jgi:hypothetical protein